jgi:hypothetical protein
MAECMGKSSIDARKRVFFCENGKFNGCPKLAEREQVSLQFVVAAAEWTGISRKGK